MLIEYIVGSKYDRNRIIRVNNFSDIDLYGSQVGEEYYSVYNYPPEVLDYMRNNNGRLKGYKAEVATDVLWWDIDSYDLDESFESTKKLVNRLKSHYGIADSNIKIFFSGRKGFHVICPSETIGRVGFTPYTHTIVRKVCLDIAVDISFIDDKVYNKNRILRIPNSCHSDTSMYKVDITDVFNNDDAQSSIMERAKDQHITVWEQPVGDSPQLESIITSALSYVSENLAIASESTASSQEILNILINGIEEGSRNDSLTRVAGMLHQKHDDSYVRAMLHLINKNSKKPLPDHEVESVATSVAQYPVEATYLPVSIQNVSTIRRASKKWFDTFTRSGFHSFGESFTHLTSEMEMLFPGDVVGIVGNSGTGKTLLGVQLVNSSARVAKARAAIFSLEMSDEGLFFRIAIQESANLSDENGYVSPKLVAMELFENQGLSNKIYNDYESILVVDSATSIEQIISYIELIKDELKKNGEVLTDVLLDYGQLLDGTIENGKAAAIARGMKPIAKRFEIKFYILLQLNKSIVNKYTEPTSQQIEGTGGWYQACDYMVYIWLNKDDKKILSARIGKNRWGMEGNYFSFVKDGLKLKTIEYVEPIGNPLDSDAE